VYEVWAMTQPEASGKKSMNSLVDERLLEEFAPLIRYLAYRFSFRLPPSMETEDLVHAGILGLMDALEKYDSSREAQFKTYAEFRIRGAMLDEIRSQNWIPRSIQEKVSLLHRTTEELTKRLGREPNQDELAAELKMEKEELYQFLIQARASSMLSLDDLGLEDKDEKVFYEALADEKSEDPLFSLLNEESRQKLVEAVSLLPEKEKLVVSLYYREELNMKDIGKILKLTESRVCQLHSQAISRLKTILHKTE
jgi:RNA polymerase sigma factor for flagellar operon FliA